ncbi:MAG: FliM/FliN family flagellar motor C-terminal domain-containing protein [Microthrixaceae bacterium]
MTFPSVQVPSHRILALDVGDVIGLGADPDAVLPLRVDGLHLADVRPARAGSDVACQIVSTAVTTSRNSGKHSVSSPTGPSAPGGLL